MVPALLCILFGRYLKNRWPVIRRKLPGIASYKSVILLAAFLLLLVMKFASLRAQDTELHYKIVRNDKTIGWTNLQKNKNSKGESIRLQSDVKTRFVFQFNISVREEVVLSGGIITYASQYRSMNGDVKENKSLRFTGKGYEISKGKEIQQLAYSALSNNMLCLFFEEPLSFNKVFSDKFQRMLEIRKIAQGSYRINFPDGNSSCYYYQNGICTKVTLNHSLYSAEMVLVQ